MSPLNIIGGNNRSLGRARTPVLNGALAMVPSELSLYAEWSNPANLSPSSPLNFSGDSGDHTSSIISSGYGDAPPYGGPNIVSRLATATGSPIVGDFGNLGIDGFTTNYACFVHIWKWLGTDGSDGYPYSWVNGGNKQAFFNPIGTGRAYTVCRAQVPFTTYDAEENYRQIDLALEGFSPVTGIGRGVGETDENYLISLDTWIVMTVILDYRGGAGNGIAAYYMKKSSGEHYLQADRDDLTFPGSTWGSAYVNNTNNGRTGSQYPFSGTMYDAYFGVFT